MIQFAPARGAERLKQALDSFRSHFRGIPDRPGFRDKVSGVSAPAVRYVIYFTPRSGSSRLTDLIENAGGCGSPREFFNPTWMRKNAEFMGAQSLRDYLNLLTRRFGHTGVFGCEITSGHMVAVFRGGRRFSELLRPTASIFLIRENIIAQAVSASRMKQTGVAHNVGEVRANTGRAEFRYSPRQIHYYLGRLLYMERQLEGFFRRAGVEPLRISYEILTDNSPQQSVSRIAAHIGARAEQLDGLDSRHQKIGDELSREYVARFRREHVRLVGKIDSYREPILRRLGENP